MLTAAARKKLKRKIVLHEDEVTSCIFGEMQYLPSDVIWKIFKQLTKDAIKDTGAIKNLFSELPDDVSSDKVDFEFWPEWETKSGKAIPDIVIHFFKDDKPILNIIVEVKWNASLFPPCELIRQWSRRKAGNSNEAQWVHLYLVKDIATGLAEVENSLLEGEDLCKNKNCYRCADKDRASYMGPKFKPDEWRESFGCIGWRHLIVAVTQIVKRNHLWNKGVSIFFAKQGIEMFSGFEWIKKYFEIETVSKEEMLFFSKTPWFLNTEVFDDNEIEHFFPIENAILHERSDVMEGKTLKKAAEIIVKAEGQINAMIDTLDSNLRDELEKKYSRVDSSEKFDDWIWFRNYALVEKGRKKASRHLAIQVVLYDDEEAEIDGWEPSLYVMYGEGKEPFSVNDWGFALSEPLNAFSAIKHGDRLLRWEATDDVDAGWGFVLPLVKLNSEEALVKEIVTPVKKLLEDKPTSNPFPDKSVAFQFTQGKDGLSILKVFPKGNN